MGLVLRYFEINNSEIVIHVLGTIGTLNFQDFIKSVCYYKFFCLYFSQKIE